MRKKKSLDENPDEPSVATVGVRELRAKLRLWTTSPRPVMVESHGARLCVILPLGVEGWADRYDFAKQRRNFDRHAAAARKKLGGDED